jgi:hypothetical protein
MTEFGVALFRDRQRFLIDSIHKKSQRSCILFTPDYVAVFFNRNELNIRRFLCFDINIYREINQLGGFAYFLGRVRENTYLRAKMRRTRELSTKLSTVFGDKKRAGIRAEWDIRPSR